MPDNELREWIELSRSITEDDRTRHSPPPEILGRVLATLAQDDDASSAGSDVADLDRLEPASPTIDLAHEREVRAPVARRRHRRNLVLASVAAAVALVVGFALFPGDEPDATFVAEATNNDLPERFEGFATATLTVDDSPTLTIDVSANLPATEPVELWLIKPDLSDMVSLGTIQPGQTEWAWPAGYAPSEYTLVDLSIEPDDGDPTHSGRSILRGELRAI